MFETSWYLGKRVVSSLVPSQEQRRCDVFVFVVVAVVDVAHNEALANVTVVLSHRHADCQREYCRTVIGLFEETRADGRIDADLSKGGKKHYLASIRNVRLTISEATRDSFFHFLSSRRSTFIFVIVAFWRKSRDFHTLLRNK